MRLRHTLVTLQIALVAVGLLVFGVTSYQLYRHSEETRLHNQLTQDTPSLEAALCAQAGAGCSFPNRPDGDADDRPNPAPRGTATTTAVATATTPAREVCGFRPDSFLGNNLAPGSFIQERSATGAVVARLYVPFSPFSAYDSTTPTCPQPDLPARVPAGTFQVGAVDGPGPFLVEVVSPGMRTAPGAGGGLNLTVPAGTVYVVGIPLDSLHSSLHRLLTLDLAVGGILLVALAGGSLLLIRRSLRPLERMAATSRAISTGDLSRRVTATDSRSEVGQLGLALNGMLTRIERAFDERDATEQRLRQFLADASHELRTPLTSIRGYAELWRISRDGDSRPANGAGVELDADTAMARIEEHARRMGEMIEELLLLARLDETHPSRHAPVDLAVVAAEACDDASALDPARPISLDADDDVIVVGDAAHLRRAVSNLLTNAVRHTPSGTPVEVHVGVDGGVAELVVRDHGPGLPAAGLAHAFDRFWQADASRATGGSGLGLAIVAGVAAEHGGAAVVTNAPDGGAVLTIRLPRPLPPAPPEAPAPGPSRRDDQPSTR